MIDRRAKGGKIRTKRCQVEMKRLAKSLPARRREIGRTRRPTRQERGREQESKRTRYDIPGIHGILVLDEAKAIHELDLGDLTRAMGRKVSLDIGLGGCRSRCG